jgi:cytochrome c553
MAEDLQRLLGDMHEELIVQVLEDLKNGDRKARSEAMALLKSNNVTAIAAEGSTLRKIAGKLDFSQMADKVIELKRPHAAG